MLGFLTVRICAWEVKLNEPARLHGTCPAKDKADDPDPEELIAPDQDEVLDLQAHMQDLEKS